MADSEAEPKQTMPIFFLILGASDFLVREVALTRPVRPQWTKF